MSDLDDRPVRLVLDTSAIAGYAAGSPAVGELLGEIDAEDGTVLIPYPCLIEAAANAAPDQGAWITLLLRHPAAVLAVEDLDQWPMVAGVRAILGKYEPTAAAWAALVCRVDILTRHPEIYEPLGDDIALPFTD